MFIREKKNKSGSVSIQILSKENGRKRLLKTIGCASDRLEIDALKIKAQETLEELSAQSSSSHNEEDQQFINTIASLSNRNIQTIGPELIFGRIYDDIGFHQIKDEQFRHLVMARLAFPLSKLKTIDYLRRYQGSKLRIEVLYRYLDGLANKHKPRLEQIALAHALRMHDAVLNTVFYKITRLHYVSEDEDDLARISSLNITKAQHPTIYLGLLVSANGYPISYDILKGRSFEGTCLTTWLEALSSKFNIGKPIVMAASGLLSQGQIKALEDKGYDYLVGANLASKTSEKNNMAKLSWEDGESRSFDLPAQQRLVVHYSAERAQRDAANRRKGLKRLQQGILTGALTEKNSNQRGYNKYLKPHVDGSIEIDWQRYEADAAWEGLRAYLTNSSLKDEELLSQYGQLQQIQKAFRLSNTDLSVAPIHHRLENRICAHLSIAFSAYTIHLRLDTALRQAGSTLSLDKAAELTQTMYQVVLDLAASKQSQTILLGMDAQQQALRNICEKHFK